MDRFRITVNTKNIKTIKILKEKNEMATRQWLELLAN